MPTAERMRHLLLFLGLIVWLGTEPLLAIAQVEEDTTAIGLGFDDIEEEPPPAVSSGGWFDMMHISGRFDLNLEIENPVEEGASRDRRFRNYHRFLFLKVTPTEQLTLDAEVLDLTYYEMAYQISDKWSIRAGKIWVPFGATPFHHYYGGRQGDPFDGLLLPNVWSEFGAGLEGSLLRADNITLDGNIYTIRGFDAPLGDVVDFTNGGADDVFAFGGRTHLTIGTKISIWGSILYNQFGQDDEGQIVLWGGDILLDYGLVDLPVLKDLRVRAAFARADIQDEVLVEESANSDHWYFRYGDYAEVSYRGVGYVIPRIRYGTIIDIDDRVSNADSHNWEVALLSRLDRHLMVLAQYQFNQEEVNEIDNDLFRFAFIFEF